jgi:hypothetical protein
VELFEMDKENKQMCEPVFLNDESRERQKSTQRRTRALFFVSPQKGTSLDEGTFLVEL